MATVPVVEIGLRRLRNHADGGEEQLTLGCLNDTLAML